MSNESDLAARYDAIIARIKLLEQQPCIQDALAAYKISELQHAILKRIDNLARALGLDLATQGAQAKPGPAPPAPPPRPRPTVTPDASPTQQRLEQELIERDFSSFRFARVPSDYYDQPLEFRRACLSAASVDHLCKSIVMDNTRAHPSVTGWQDPAHSKYYCVIVQYTARLHADKLKMALMELGGRKFGRQYYNMRLAAEEVNDSLTGYSHNAVTPVGMRERLPIILSHRITELQPREFWLGGGEMDLKVGFDVEEFLTAYQPIVLDCTYD